MPNGLNPPDIVNAVRLVGQMMGRQPAGEVSTALAGAFGWTAADVRPRSIGLGGTRIDVARGYLGAQPAAVFASPVHRNGRAPLDGAALYAYHAAIHWGVMADHDGLTVFNSHWLVRDDWFRLPISWDQIEQERHVLEALQPDGLADGTIDRLALSGQPPPKLLQPVDDELVDRLDAWRDEALRYSRQQQGTDERLQQLFAQLFVLRTVEDRGLAPDLPPLASTLRGIDRIDANSLRDLFIRARATVGSELFEDFPGLQLPQHVVAGIIHDLYQPRELPKQNLRYNFAWIDSDVLGLAYEKYLSTILYPLPPSPQMEMFRQPERDVERISVRRATGVYYTPLFITGYLARRCIDGYYAANPHAGLPRVIDFACGSGSFLIAAANALLVRLKRLDPTRNWARELIDGGHINGIDADAKAVTVARLNLWQRFTEEPDPLPLPDLSRAIVQGDGLRRETWGELSAREYDIALGNPPFLVTSRVPQREYLEANFETARGRYDFSYLFVEQATKIISALGLLGMVVPNRLYRNRNGAGIRQLLTQKTNLLTIMDFHSNEVFQKTSSYIGCIVAQNRGPEEPLSDRVRVIDVESLPPRFAAAMLLEAERAATDTKTPVWRVYFAQHPRGAAPWILLSRQEQLSQVRLGEESEPLESVAGIFQGIRTGANEIFIVNVQSDDEEFVAQVINGLGETGLIERSLLRPVIFGSEVRRYDLIAATKRLIYPYVRGMVISEPELEQQYPQASHYFAQYRDILSARNSIAAASGLRWYELVRRRDEEWLTQPKLLIRDLAPETAFAIDPLGGTFIVGGTAVVPERDELLYPLLAYLNSREIDALVRRTTPQFRGGFQKFEPQHLQRIPVIKELIEDPAFSERLGALASQIVQARLAPDYARVDALETEISRILSAVMQSHNIAVGA